MYMKEDFWASALVFESGATWRVPGRPALVWVIAAPDRPPPCGPMIVSACKGIIKTYRYAEPNSISPSV